MKRLLPWLCAMLLAISLPALAQRIADVPDENNRALQALLTLPDEQIDLAAAKLTIDHMVAPDIDVAAARAQLDTMAKQIASRLPADASSRDKLDALRAYLYQSGPWNDHRPFQYDLDDPLGRKLRSKLLPTYLATRKGNCVSMPFLFLVLGQKLGLDLSASTAPHHVFVKYRDDQGRWYNLETTSGAGFTRDAWLQQQMPMTPQALTNGLYLQPLSKKESVVVMANTLLEHYQETGQSERIIAQGKVMLSYYPVDVATMLHIGSAYYKLIERDFVRPYPNPADIPPEKRARYLTLSQANQYWFKQAETLGWRPDPAYSQNAVNPDTK